MYTDIHISVVITLGASSVDWAQGLRSFFESAPPARTEVILSGEIFYDARVIDSYKKRYPKVKIIRCNRGGLAAARNRGLFAARGEYVVFANGDDKIAWEQLYAIYEQAKQADADMLLTQVVYQQPNTDEVPDATEQHVPDSLLNITMSGRYAFITLMRINRFIPQVDGGLYKREWLENNDLNFDEDCICSDELWCPKAFCMAERVMLSSSVFYYRLREAEPNIYNVDREGGVWAKHLFYAGDQMSDFSQSFTAFDEDQELKSWLLTNALRIYTSACRIVTAIRIHGTFELPQHKMHIFKIIDYKMSPEAAKRCRSYYKLAASWEQEYLLWKNNPCDPIISAMPTSELDHKRIILIYNSPGWQDYRHTLEHLPAGYALTLDRKYLDRAFAVVFHLPGLFEHLYDDLEKRDGQIWIRWNMEPDCNFKWMQQLDQLDIFDFRMDYHPESDLVCPYYAGFHPERVARHVEQDMQKDKICMLISSSVHQSGREEYLAELMQYTGVDSYGRLYNNCCMKEDKGWESKIALYSQYKFVIAFENSRQEDYVTEKLYDPLLAGAVPIYLGAPNVDNYLPGENCIIRADRFRSPKALAEYIEQCYANRDEYMKYHQWRFQSWRRDFLNKVAIQDESPFVRLCHLLDTRYPQEKHNRK